MTAAARYIRPGRSVALFNGVVAGLTRIGVDYVQVKTSEYLDAVLSKFLNARMADRSTTTAR